MVSPDRSDDALLQLPRRSRGSWSERQRRGGALKIARFLPARRAPSQVPLDRVDVVYDALPPCASTVASLAAGAPRLFAGTDGNNVATITMRVGSLIARRALRHFRRRVDYSETGGAPLLGVAGVAIVGHGRSSAKAVRNAVAMAYRFANQRVIERIAREIAATAVPHP